MFPLSAEKLPLREIADFWSREIKPRASRDELLARLESAWWRGELRGNSWDSRLQLLKKMFEKREEPELRSVAFVSPSDAGPPTEVPLSDGSIAVVRRIISVPNASEDWTEASCSEAFEALASLPSEEYFPLFSYAICFIDLTYEEFFGWVRTRRFDLPTFWRTEFADAKISPEQKTRETVKTLRRISRAEAVEVYKRFRSEYDGIPTRHEEELYMRERGVARTWVREFRLDFPLRKRGERITKAK
ncbi:hypothetical protein J4G48_0045060 [Bradyrhizobium barranii subsp. apii]|uniref:hypothetical protein n=1 Tax=Bradyrhizobium barranii TaxID=2992140 RepID=UPI001AA19E3E|nr:hypothetical protein [Bradyrhizobium barranii]UPT96131.1 hypothetical protein J4G48_0045060 [Bradyrhizobium barranii subsp. apii]